MVSSIFIFIEDLNFKAMKDYVSYASKFGFWDTISFVLLSIIYYSNIVGKIVLKKYILKQEWEIKRTII